MSSQVLDLIPVLKDVTGKRRHIMNSSKLFLISSSAELTLLKLGPFLTMSDILMDIINAGVNISSGNPASAAIGYAMLFTCFLYPGKMHGTSKFCMFRRTVLSKGYIRIQDRIKLSSKSPLYMGTIVNLALKISI